MLESIFYFQICVFLVLLIWALYSRSASFMAVAAVFSMLTGVMLVSDGIQYPTGYAVVGADDNHMTINEVYTTQYTFNSNPVNMWHYILLYGGFVWLIIAFLLAMKGRQGDFIEKA